MHSSRLTPASTAAEASPGRIIGFRVSDRVGLTTPALTCRIRPSTEESPGLRGCTTSVYIKNGKRRMLYDHLHVSGVRGCLVP